MRYSGVIGYVAGTTEDPPGVWEEQIVEREYVGNVVQRTEMLDSESSILPKYRTTTSISVLYNGPGTHYQTIRYVSFMGKRWTISSVVLQPPRIVLYIGEEYHGPAAVAP